MKTILEIISKSLAKYFWEKAEEIDNIKCVNMDTLAEKVDKSKKLYKQFNSLPECIKEYIGNSHKSDFIIAE